MKKLHLLRAMLIAVVAMWGCTTADVGEPTVTIDPAKYYEISTPFAEYLDYNTKFQPNPNGADGHVNYAMPAGIVVLHEGKWYLDKDLAKTVNATSSTVYLSQPAANIELLKEQSYTGAKITDIDGIQFFTSVRRLYITDLDVEGELDLSPFPNLTVVQASRGLFSSIINVPAGVTDFRCSARDGSALTQRLSALDLSLCTAIARIDLDNVQIPSDALKLPDAPTASITPVTMVGAIGLPYPCTQAFYDKVADKKQYFEVAVVKIDANLGARLMTAGLPAGTVTMEGSDYILDKSKAAGVTTLDINGAAAITTISDLQYFKNLTSLNISNTGVTGTADFSAFTKLATLNMNGTLYGAVKLPASIVTFSYDANASAIAGQKLTAIDFGACNGLQTATLKNHTITAFSEPGIPAKSNIAIDLTGNTPAAEFEVLATFFSRLTTASQAFFRVASAPEAGAFSIVWDPTDFATVGGGVSPWAYKSAKSSPADIRERGIVGLPEIVRTAAAFAYTTAPSPLNMFSFGLGTRTNIKDSADDAAAAGQYATVKITNSATSPLSLTFTNLITTTWRSGAGANNIDFQYSTDNGVTFTKLITIAVDEVSSVSQSQANATGSVKQTIDLTSIPAVTAGNSVIIRLVPWGKALGSSNNGTCAFASAQRDTPVGGETFSINGVAQ